MAERIGIEKLRPGMVILQVTAQNGPVRIRKAGLVTSTDMVRGLAEMGVQELDIDPDQTVELDAPDIPLSPTQQLLQRAGTSEHKLDHALADQFNRSLFLPSVQELPSLWRHYGKRSAIATLTVVGGFALGWVVATYQHWSAAWFVEQDPALVESAPAAPIVQEPKTEPAPTANPSPQVEQVAPEAESQEVATTSIQVPSLAVEPRQQQIAPVASQDNPAPQSAAISPGLLKRFEQALNDIDERADSEFQVPAPSDIPKVHELPARLLTELPSMAFSAHMYASEPSHRWLRVNGQRLREGDVIDNKVQIINIEPQHVILSFRGQDFSMPALTDW